MITHLSLHIIKKMQLIYSLDIEFLTSSEENELDEETNENNTLIEEEGNKLNSIKTNIINNISTIMKNPSSSNTRIIIKWFKSKLLAQGSILLDAHSNYTLL